MTDHFIHFNDELISDSPSSTSSRQLRDASKIQQFALAGNATLTLKSKTTQARFTYKITKCEDNDALYFVALLRGQDNEGDYTYLGTIRIMQLGPLYKHGLKSKIGPEAPGAKAFEWFWRNLMRGGVSETVEVWHEGLCARRGRKLTVPSSIESGYGPECIKYVGRML